MNRAFEKILKKIEEKRNKYQRLADGSNFDGWKEEDIKYSAKAEMCEELKEIVQEVAEEYNGGWIMCSEKLPELRKDVLVTVKYTGFMGMHGYWIKTGHMEAENDWWGDCAGGEVIAWQPLPEPYKERD